MSLCNEMAGGVATHLPGLLVGIGTSPLPILSTSSGVTLSNVISDSHTPGAIAHTRTGTFLSENSVASILVRCDVAALALLYANCGWRSDPSASQVYCEARTRSRRGGGWGRCGSTSGRSTRSETYVVLRELDVAAHARDVDHARGVAGDVLAALCEQAKEGGGDEKDREGVNAIEAAPALERLVLEERTADCLGRCALGSVGVFEPRGDRSDLPSTIHWACLCQLRIRE